LKHALPFGLGTLFNAYDSHLLGTFKGGSKSLFMEQLDEIEFNPDDYLKQVRERAKEHKYDPSAIDFSDDSKHKMMIRTPEGVARFGRVGYCDYLIWSHLEKNNQVKSGTAKKKQAVFLKSHSKIKGNWKDNDYSPNWLSMRLLW
jgi:hypothetical protein